MKEKEQILALAAKIEGLEDELKELRQKLDSRLEELTAPCETCKEGQVYVGSFDPCKNILKCPIAELYIGTVSKTCPSKI